MPSSYFTRPKGLHPTPSVCFPPPPPPGGGRITGYVRVVPPVQTVGMTVQIEWEVNNKNLPLLDPVTVDWDFPGMDDPGAPLVQNGVPGNTNGLNCSTPGIYTGKMRCTWSNGQIRTFTTTYQITP